MPGLRRARAAYSVQVQRNDTARRVRQADACLPTVPCRDCSGTDGRTRCRRSCFAVTWLVQAKTKEIALAGKTIKIARPARPSREEAEQAIDTLLRWAGDDPGREGLRDTPKRVVQAYEDWFRGYGEDPVTFLERTFEEVEGYDELIVLRDIAFESHCEHHMAPIIGVAHVGYLPDNKVVGISKLARVVETFARRLQVQETMTAQIAHCIQDVLAPKGVGIVVEGVHQCMTTRGIRKPGVAMITSQLLGDFRSDPRTRAEFLNIIGRANLSV